MLEGGFFEGGTRPFVPIVVDEVCDADAEEGAVKACVEAGNAFAGDDAFGGVEGRCLGPLRFDLGAGGEGDEWVAMSMLASCL